jgi:hypothetical protein
LTTSIGTQNTQLSVSASKPDKKPLTNVWFWKNEEEAKNSLDFSNDVK